MVAALVLTAALIGCGSKGGLIPLHAWLPLAHPAAPSHVSALMSGVMTKVAIYGFVRIAFDLLGPPDWWWALPPIVLGAMTAVLGLLYAVLDRDLKRVLAYSTIENVGLIFVALGLALAFRANAQHEAAAVLAAACFVRVYGTAFLGRPRSAEAAGAHDVPLVQQAAMGGLAFLCILGGLMGSVLAAALAPVLDKLVGGALPGPGSGPTLFSLIAFDAARSVYDAPVIALFVAIASLTTLIVVHRLSERRTRRGPAWDCGVPAPPPPTPHPS